MFVRFRKRLNDARCPAVVPATRACAGRCHDRKGQRLGGGFRMGTGCPERPRCRWRIGLDRELVPYRLLVSLVDNRRVEGRTRQEHIADLGAIDGHLLPCFFDEMPLQLADARGDLVNWTKASLKERLVFWSNLEERLTKLSNRIGAEELAMIRLAVHARVPLPSGEEIAAEEVSRWLMLKAEYDRIVETEHAHIASYHRRIEKARAEIALLEPVIASIDDETKILQRHFAEGDLSIGSAAGSRQPAELLLGKILAARARSG